MQLIDGIADENNHAFVSVGGKPVTGPLLYFRPDFPAESGLLISGNTLHFSGAVLEDGVGDDLDDEREPLVELRSGEEFVQKRQAAAA